MFKSPSVVVSFNSAHPGVVQGVFRNVKQAKKLYHTFDFVRVEIDWEDNTLLLERYEAMSKYGVIKLEVYAYV